MSNKHNPQHASKTFNTVKLHAQGGRNLILAKAWEDWINHVRECPSCGEMVKEAHTVRDTSELFGNAWIIGFSTAMDMVEKGALQQVPGSGQN